MNPGDARPPDITTQQFQRDFLDYLLTVRGVDLEAATAVDCYHALAAYRAAATCCPALWTRAAPR